MEWTLSTQLSVWLSVPWAMFRRNLGGDYHHGTVYMPLMYWWFRLIDSVCFPETTTTFRREQRLSQSKEETWRTRLRFMGWVKRSRKMQDHVILAHFHPVFRRSVPPVSASAIGSCCGWRTSVAQLVKAFDVLFTKLAGYFTFILNTCTFIHIEFSVSHTILN